MEVFPHVNVRRRDMAAKGGTERDPNEMRTRWRTRSESPLAPNPAQDMAAVGHTMETVASKCLCKTISGSFRSATPKLNATFVNNPSKGQLSQKIWQLWDIQWKQWPQSAYARKNLEASEVLSPSWTQQFWAIQESSCYHRSYGSYGKCNGTDAIRVVNHTKASFLNAYPQLNAMRGDFPC